MSLCHTFFKGGEGRGWGEEKGGGRGLGRQLCKDEELIDYQTQYKKSSMVMCTCDHSARKKEIGWCFVLLTNQPCLIGKLKAKEAACVKQRRKTDSEAWHQTWSSDPHMHFHPTRHTHIQMEEGGILQNSDQTKRLVKYKMLNL